MRLIIIGLVYLSGTVLGMSNMAIACSLFLWNNIFQPLSFAHMFGAYPVAYYVLIVLVLSFMVNVGQGRVKPNLGAYFYCLAGMIFWLLITTLTSDYPNVAWPEMIKFLKYLLPLLLIYSSIQTTKDIRLIGTVLCLSVGVWAAQAGAHCLVHGVAIDMGIEESQLSDRNDFTAGIVGTLPMLVYLAFSYNWKFKRVVRWGFWGIIFLSLSAIIFSNSRGASVGLAMMLVIYILLISKKKGRDGFLMVLVLGITLMLLPDSWWERMSTINVGGEQTEASAQQRSGLMRGAFNATVDHPIFGLGPDGWGQVVSIYGDGIHNPHSIYLKLSAEAGFTGLALYLAIMGFTFWRMKQTIKLAIYAKDRDTMRLAMALIMCVMGLLAAMTFLNAPFHEYLWGWIGLCHALAQVYPREAARRRLLMNQRHSDIADSALGGKRPS